MRAASSAVRRRVSISALAALFVFFATAGLAYSVRAASAGSGATGVVTTFAGTPLTTGSSDGSGAAASFNVPRGVAVDSEESIYVADTFNSTIRKITSEGLVSTFAGTATATGTTDARGTAARFNYPRGIATDSINNVYVADTNSNTIRKIAPDGLVTTVAGTAGVAGSHDDTGALATFDHPAGIAVDTAGVVYVADTNNGTIRRIDTTGLVTTLAGSAGVVGWADGTGAAAEFNHPRGIAVDTSGNLYVADYSNNTIRKIAAGGVVTTLAGTHGVVGPPYDGVGAAAHFREPSGVAVDAAGIVYVADTYDYTVRRIDLTGQVKTLAGTAGMRGSGGGTGAAASFNAPMAIAISPIGAAYVADANDQALIPSNNTIRQIALLPTWTIVPIAGAHGTIVPGTPQDIIQGQDATFTVTPDLGYHIVSVTVDNVSVGVVPLKSYQYVFKNVTADHTIAATFAIDTFVITPTAGPNGSIVPSLPLTVNYGADATFTIKPDVNYYIAGVSVDASAVGPVPSYTFHNVVANHSILATFTRVTASIVPTAGPGGTISPNTTQTVPVGSSVTFTIVPNSGYMVDQVLVDNFPLVGPLTSYTFVPVDAENRTIAVTFKLAPLTVWRFYNFGSDSHFYTASQAERDTVINTLASSYRFEGIAYQLSKTNPVNNQPLWRFLNLRTGAHFYTASNAERDNIVSTLGGVYRLEGPAYNVSTTTGIPVYRFFNMRTGNHFYTASIAERDHVIATLWTIYRFEGPAFYLGQ